MSILFACDLDNTLLYSFKHKCEGDICVEVLKGKEQGFMSPKACDLLKEVVSKVDFVPVTTRSVEQYSRIKWLSDTSPQYAASTNGAILMKNYNKDLEWFERSEFYSKLAYNELVKLQRSLIDCDRFIKCHIVDEMYLLAYCREDIDMKKCVAECKALTTLNVVASGKKIYFFPNGLNKDSAVIRLKEKLKSNMVICAGDSELDIPMLNVADIAIVPSISMAKKIKNKNVYINKNDNFSEFVLKSVLEILNMI